jgi:hypothetical protein
MPELCRISDASFNFMAYCVFLIFDYKSKNDKWYISNGNNGNNVKNYVRCNFKKFGVIKMLMGGNGT